MIKCARGNVLSDDFTSVAGRTGFVGDKSINLTSKEDYSKYAKEISDYSRLQYGKQTKQEFLSFLDTAKPNFSGIVQRGTKLTNAQFDSLQQSARTGTLTQNKFQLSTSKHADQAQFFTTSSDEAHHAVLHIKAIDGHDISKHTTSQHEGEVVLNKGKYFQVLATKQVGSTYHVVLEEVAKHIAEAMKTKPNVEALSVFGLGLGLTKDDK